MSYLGDIAPAQVLYFHFTTRQFSTGAPITSASLALSVYKDDSATESTSGVTTTFTSGFDSRAGLVSVKIDTSADGTFYAAGHDFSVVVTGGTADSVSIVGEVVGYFSINNRSALRPATAGRTLVVDANGLADATMVKLGPSGLATAQTARDAGAQLDAAVSTRLASSSYTAPTNLTAAQIATGVWQDTTAGDFTVSASIGKSIMNGVALGTGLTVNDVTTKTGYSLSQSFPTNFSSLAITALGKVTVGTNDDKTGYTASTVSDKTGYELTSAYDAAKTAATQASVDDIPTNAELATALGTADDATLAAIAALSIPSASDVADEVETRTLLADVRKVNNITVTGSGTTGDPWRPV